ncbi:MAG: 6-phospho-alpha-glucosidase, partial [Sarcina sp.]
VEVPAYLRSWGPEVISRKPISTFYKGMIENQLASEKLAVEGYFENSYDKLLQAIAINKTVSSTNIAKKILDDFIEANGNFWPELKKEKF